MYLHTICYCMDITKNTRKQILQHTQKNQLNCLINGKQRHISTGR
jgi:hypothetical protein